MKGPLHVHEETEVENKYHIKKWELEPCFQCV